MHPARFIFLALIFSLLFGVVAFKLYRVQIEQSDYYFDRASAQKEARDQLNLRRGQILVTDKFGNSIPVAMNSDAPVVYAVPKDINNPASTSRALAPIIGWDEAKLLKAINNPTSKFRLLVEQASDDVVSKVRNLNVIGIYTDTEQYRSYPSKRRASQVLGFVGKNDQSPEPAGIYGIEKLRNETLASGSEVRLTLDRNLQEEAEAELATLVRDHHASGGSILIQDPKTGAILAMASNPDFDPNHYSDSPISTFMNPAVQYVYEPGSVFKPLTMTAGIDSGAITPDTTYVDTGSITLNGMTIRNWDLKAHGKISMTGVIEDSVNTGAIFAEQKTGAKTFYEYLKRFGFGDKTAVDLPDEVSGSVRNLERKDARMVDYATASYGQGVSVTPLQLITAYSAVANGGLLMKPYITLGTKPEVVRRVAEGDTTRKVLGMMESAVQKNIIAAIPHYRIAGKTGTAYIPVKGGYDKENVIHSYVGIFPASDPKVVLLLKLERPNKPLAGQTVVPAFHDLAQFVINYYQIPPDRDLDTSAPKT